jgi:hypothetical protein
MPDHIIGEAPVSVGCAPCTFDRCNFFISYWHSRVELHNEIVISTEGVAMSMHASSSTAACEPTILETELDSICLTLTKMKNRIHRVPMLDHMSDAERAELTAALHRAQGKLAELDNAIKAHS